MCSEEAQTEKNPKPVWLEHFLDPHHATNTPHKHFHRQKPACTKLTFNKGFVYTSRRQHGPIRKGSVGCLMPGEGWGRGGGDGRDISSQPQMWLHSWSASAALPPPECAGISRLQEPDPCQGDLGVCRGEKGSANLAQDTLPFDSDMLKQVLPKSSWESTAGSENRFRPQWTHRYCYLILRLVYLRQLIT